MSVSFLAFQRWQRLWDSLNCPSCPSPTSPSPSPSLCLLSLVPSISSPRLTHSVLGIPPPPSLHLHGPHHLSRQSFALNQKAAAPRAPPPPPPSILLITPSAPSPLLPSFHHQPPLPSQHSLSPFYSLYIFPLSPHPHPHTTHLLQHPCS